MAIGQARLKKIRDGVRDQFEELIDFLNYDEIKWLQENWDKEVPLIKKYLDLSVDQRRERLERKKHGNTKQDHKAGAEDCSPREEDA